MEKPSLEAEELQLVIFKIAGEEFGVDINQTKEIVRLIPITSVPKAPVFIKGVVNLRGQILVVIDLAKRLNLTSVLHPEKARIIVLELKESVAGMIVDEVVEVVKISRKNIEGKPELIAAEAQYEYLKGVAKLGKRLVVLIDLIKVFSTEEIQDLKKITN